MHQSNKSYWRSVEELEKSTPVAQEQEFSIPINNNNSFDVDNTGTFRRDFLKAMGFSLAAATFAACETPVRKAIPYVNKPEDVDPTIPNWYASTYFDGSDFCSILVKTREGRPIKIEGNKFSSISQGGINARVAASVLSLYDKERYRGPKIGDQSVTWEDLDAKVVSELSKIASSGKSIAIVSNTIISPTLLKSIETFKSKFGNASHITYDTASFSAMLDANEKSFGIRALPTYDFSAAKAIVSFNADFLGTWGSTIEHAKQYAKGRKIGKSKKEMSRHYQFETTMSLTGSNADYRTAIKPSQEGLIIANLYNLIASKLGGSKLNVGQLKNIQNFEKAADDLLKNKGQSLVISGSNDINVQLTVNAINNLLQNYGKTLSLGLPTYLKKGSDSTFSGFVKSLENGAIGAVIFLNCNPVYDSALGQKLKTALPKAGLTIAISDRPNETTVLCNIIAADNHYLESWTDANPRKNIFTIGQPTISPLFKTRQALETISIWAGMSGDAYTLINNIWKSDVFSTQTQFSTYADFWNHTAYYGVFEGIKKQSKNDDNPGLKALFSSSIPFVFDIATVENNISTTYKANSESLEYYLYEKVGIGNGSQANNPWLQEFPEPISKACWDNYVCISPKLATEKGVKQNEIVSITAANGTKVNLPILIQPGQAYNTIAVAVGYGREVSGKVANGVGANMYPFQNLDENVSSFGIITEFVTTGESREIAQTQTHQTMMARPIVQESTFQEYLKNPSAGKVEFKIHTSEGEKKVSDVSIWNTKGLKTHDYNNHFWGLAIDLNSCIGCGTCIISCQAENNVPVVGRKEVINRREMHWIRIDRYYSTDAQNLEDKSVSGLMDKQREEAAENPQVVFQPVMCQHCNNAPCETVCPVLATTHSTEGLNQMTYNRCVGTRYCANNCPYKVRRFNWFKYYENSKFDYNLNDDLGKMVLNPDVTVRARGVMEKCSMCVQRIQAGKLTAKLEKRRPIDGEIETACSQSCPSEAIVFGDMNDPESRISKLLNDENKERAYHLLEELNVKPSVSYLTKIRNV